MRSRVQEWSTCAYKMPGVDAPGQNVQSLGLSRSLSSAVADNAMCALQVSRKLMVILLNLNFYGNPPWLYIVKSLVKYL